MFIISVCCGCRQCEIAVYMPKQRQQSSYHSLNVQQRKTEATSIDEHINRNLHKANLIKASFAESYQIFSMHQKIKVSRLLEIIIRHTMVGEVEER